MLYRISIACVLVYICIVQINRNVNCKVKEGETENITEPSIEIYQSLGHLVQEG
jgi:hypothetical protein